MDPYGMDVQSNSLEGTLQLICSSLSPGDGLSTINTLIKIVQNVVDNPGVDQYRQVRTANKTFNQRVWRHFSAREFIFAIGWIEVGDLLILPSDDLLQEALIELTVVKSALEQDLSASEGASTSGVADSRAVEYQERMKQLRELRKKEQEEKKKIADQIKADRRETDQREAKPSHGRELKFGANMNRFEDIGVDLNSGVRVDEVKLAWLAGQGIRDHYFGLLATLSAELNAIPQICCVWE